MLTATNSGSLPASDRDDAVETPRFDTSAVFTGNSELRAKIKARLHADFSQADLAREIGTSSSALSKWMNGKPAGDVASLEDLLAIWEMNVDQRVDLRRALVHTAITRRVCGIARSIANTADFGLLTGEAGLGKTSGLQLYKLENPSAILLTASQHMGRDGDLIAGLWKEIIVRLGKSEASVKRPDVIKRRLRGSNRLIIIDDAHHLCNSGLRGAVTIHNETGCPMLMAGNPSILDKICRLTDEDQYTSRIGQNRKVVMIRPPDAEELADLLLTQYAPQHKATLRRQAIEVAAKRGHGRKLKKQLRLTQEILDGGLPHSAEIKGMRQDGMTEAQIAFALAHTQLLTMPEETR